MISECARCGHEIDTSTADGSEQGVTRAWTGDRYEDFHTLCRSLDLKERRAAVMADRQAGGQQRRKPGPKPKQHPEPVPAIAGGDDELD